MKRYYAAALLLIGNLLFSCFPLILWAQEIYSHFDDTDEAEDEDDDEQGVEEFNNDVSYRSLNAKTKKEPVQIASVVPMVMPSVIVTAAERKLSCPLNFDLRGEECVTHELVSPTVECPPGYTFQDGRCLTFARPRMDCPPDFRLSGGRCTAVDVVAVQYGCPDGILDETGYGCRLIEPVGPRCPPGFELEGDVCTQSFPAPLQCEEGRVVGKHGCMRPLQFDAQLMCPPGSEIDMSGTACYKLQHRPAKCPTGFREGPISGKCEKKVKKIHAACYPEFVPVSRHSEFCERRLQFPPQLSCPLEARLDPTSGQCVSEMATGFLCPEGFVLSRSVANTCEKIVEEIGTCPPGVIPIGHGKDLRCQTVVDHEIIECCPPAFDHVFGKCERRELFTPIKSCGDCVGVRNVPVSYGCPEGFALTGQRCLRRVFEACTEQTSEAAKKCGAYRRLLDSTSLRSLTSLNPASFIPPECLHPPSVESSEKKVCQREEVIPAEIKCPEGTQFAGTTCIERYEIPVELKCPVGTLDPATGQCVKLTTVPLKTECLPGTTRIGSRCVQYEDHAPLFTCPPEAVLNRDTGSCVLRLPALAGPVEVFQSAPIALCPSGTLHDGTCWDVERIPRHLVCPEGAVPADHGDHYCIIFADFSVTPPIKKRVKPLYFCSDGTRPNSQKKCNSQDFAPMVPVCPPGSRIDSNGRRCLRQMKPVGAHPRITSATAIPICPVGTVVQGTKCVSAKEFPPNIICPPGFLRSGLSGGNRECAREAEPIPICSPGSVHTPEGCLRAVIVSPTVAHVPLDNCTAGEGC